MNKKQLISSWLIVLISVFPLFAQDKHPIDKLEEKCISKDYSTAGVTNCIIEAQKEWDVELNKYYKLLTGLLDKDAKIKLRESQLAWIKFRDAEFENIENMYLQDATIYIPIRASDRKNIVMQRALQLKSYYEAMKENK